MTARCSICRTLVQTTDASSTCESCLQTFHTSCWTELGGCATYGCEKAAVAEKPALAPVVGAGWGDTKACPACGATIGSGLLVCRCGAEFPYADPMTRDEYRVWRAKGNATRRVRTTLLVLFLVSLAGLTAPVTGAIAGYIAWRERTRMQGADGTYLAMGYGAAALGATHTLVILFLLLGL